ncbi:hypothetical protein [Clostridium felsineum]|uniref:Uncharacterized protein n=1 Tax=Clostridium felsineum TaxID=36839 RepID=A0A1S8L2V7_9CLOT|nr:hypothetical protein [Clostridium felsineum]MCR3761692.1 hypothetical protein [Clostridium felsineum]URZ07424.1 hypothetical protein CLROS_027620 [Clostridium felsineum]URZ12455.1 hypothetical protein CROST_031770 [Clostridium felsineum]
MYYNNNSKKKSKKKFLLIPLAIFIVLVLLIIFIPRNPNNDTKQAKQTEALQEQASSQIGMPNITNFYEKNMMKTIMEDCDNSNLITYSYIKNDMTGKFTYLGESMGYGLPYGTEYTNPKYSNDNGITLPQADPNGLYKAQNVHATWIMLIDPSTKQAKPVYIESDVTVSPFKLPKNLLDTSTLPADY